MQPYTHIPPPIVPGFRDIDPFSSEMERDRESQSEFYPDLKRERKRQLSWEREQEKQMQMHRLKEKKNKTKGIAKKHKR